MESHRKGGFKEQTVHRKKSKNIRACALPHFRYCSDHKREKDSHGVRKRMYYELFKLIQLCSNILRFIYRACGIHFVVENTRR